MRMTRAERGSGDAEVQYMLAQMYRNGDGVRQDMTKAVRFLEKAADQGGAIAQYQLGLMTNRGEGGLKKDDEAAAQLYRRSADQGFAMAQLNLGLCYHKSVGVPQDRAMAVRLYRKAADQGIAEAQFMLGGCYAYGDGVLPDLIAAVHWLRRAVKQHNEDAREALSEVEPHLRCSTAAVRRRGEDRSYSCVFLCRSASFCDKDCQRKLWKSHK